MHEPAFLRLVALVAFVGTYLGLGLGRVPGLRVDRTGIAIIGAAVMVVGGVIRWDQAVAAVDAHTLVLLFGMMVVTAYLRLSGFFALVTAWMVHRATTPAWLPGRPRRHIRGALRAFRERRGLFRPRPARPRPDAAARPAPARLSDRPGDRLQRGQRGDTHGQPAEHADREFLRPQLPELPGPTGAGGDPRAGVRVRGGVARVSPAAPARPARRAVSRAHSRALSAHDQDHRRNRRDAGRFPRRSPDRARGHRRRGVLAAHAPSEPGKGLPRDRLGSAGTVHRHVRADRRRRGRGDRSEVIGGGTSCQRPERGDLHDRDRCSEQCRLQRAGRAPSEAGHRVAARSRARLAAPRHGVDPGRQCHHRGLGRQPHRRGGRPEARDSDRVPRVFRVGLPLTLVTVLLGWLLVTSGA